ncbi:YhcH/YjgK/YiaL family protein [Paenibacillus sp. N4]|uniref:YhcH/YjgK/YiaL family protein n=1 Tax=Paenibacillus vietnamensis TaxID=2590547 RepID=UPI001CD1606B|nr:YhcH/YjgK/YiaL family protein [Paenibacillus vietnamensis]MCA0756084.1 YhcH/YjgK/YiaL family protein [Paenibacillus vietnamensis]
MIIGDIKHMDQERHIYPEAIRKALEHLQSGGLSGKEPGKYELEEGGLMFALVQRIVTKPSGEQRLESHETYVDVQFVVSGEERIDVIKLSDQLVIEEQDLAGRDVVFYERKEKLESSLVLTPGQFAVFYPSDVHRPCCSVDGPGEVKKVVIKIHKQLWDVI